MLAAVLTAGPVRGHDPEQIDTLPEWLVLVLKFVSDTHVEPVTGIVVSEQGHVLVPAEFVADGNAMVVLDGGADIVRNGRPAAVLETFNLDGLAILEVEHLRRPPVSLATVGVAPGERIMLMAFPPAEQISAGTRALVRIAERPTAGGENIALPNVTGALVNGCGQWVGLSAARGVQNMSIAANTIYLGREDLARWAEGAGYELVGGDCTHSLDPHVSQVGEAVPDGLGQDDPGMGPSMADAPVQATADDPETAAVNPTAGQGAAEKAPPAGQPGATPESNTQAVGEEPSASQSGTTNLAAEPDGQAAQAIGNDADAMVREGPSPGTGSGASNTGLLITLAVLAAALAALLVILLGSARRRAGPAEYLLRPVGGSDELPVRSRKGVIEVTLGRFGTDLRLEGSSVSRLHARISGVPGSVTLVDLGSSNGTFVNGVVCTPGRPVALADGDEIRLGKRAYRFLRAPLQGGEG